MRMTTEYDVNTTLLVVSDPKSNEHVEVFRFRTGEFTSTEWIEILSNCHAAAYPNTHFGKTLWAAAGQILGISAADIERIHDQVLLPTPQMARQMKALAGPNGRFIAEMMLASQKET